MKINLKYLSLALLLGSYFASAQESNSGKKLWARSVLNQKAPQLLVEKWLTDTPSVKGKFVLIDFWATWCGPCRAAIPDLNEWSEKFKDKLVIIGLSDEAEEKVKPYQDSHIRYYSAIDPQKRTSSTLEITGIPHCLLISPQGTVIWEGFPFLQGAELNEKVLEKLFKKYGTQEKSAAEK